MKTIHSLSLIALMIAATATLGFTTLAESHPEFGSKHGGHGRHMERRFAEALDLTDEQIEEIQALRDAYRPSLEATGSQLRDLEKALQDAVQAQIELGDIDQVTLDELGAQIGAAQAEMAATRGQLQIEIHGHLTPEQIERARELRSRRDEHRRRGDRGRHRGGRHGRGAGGYSGDGAPQNGPGGPSRS